MKRIMKTLITTMLIIILTSSMGVPAQAKTYRISGRTVKISAGGYSETFSVYSTKAEADANPIIFYADKYSFPVDVVISSCDGFKTEYRFDSYGIKNVKDQYSALFSSTYWVYATIDIQPYPQPNSSSKTTAETPTEDELIDEKVKQLFDELDLGFCYIEATPYYKELKAFLAGEWDGTKIPVDVDNPYAGYAASREIRYRTYTWCGINLYTGKSEVKNINVDYIGYLETVPSGNTSQEFSFAVSRVNKTFEQWHLLDKVDTWTLPKDAGAIDQIYLIGENSGDPEECQAIIFTLDIEEQSHMYSLYPGGIIEKTY